MDRRASGILLPMASLHTRFGIGDFGPEAERFIDFLSEAGQAYWQILPFNPTDLGTDNSPYLSVSAFAGNPLLISPDRLVEEGLLLPEELEPAPENPTHCIQYEAVIGYKSRLFERAFVRFLERGDDADFYRFRQRHLEWLEDYARFSALKAHFGGTIWMDWPRELRDRRPHALRVMDEALEREILKAQFLQYVFYTQWTRLHAYAHQKGIRILGDIPIYVALDSVDVWSHPEIFKLDAEKRPRFVAGCPPDYFSETGQLWGNPVYDWEVIEKEDFHWWVQRICHNMALFDYVRIDHFRGLIGYWEVSAHEKTAVHGRWVLAPGEALLARIRNLFPSSSLPLFAEDLGVITSDVVAVMEKFGLPGMKVLQFAFGGRVAENPYIPYNVPRHAVLYTGTHDNNTVRGWFTHDATPEEKRNLFRYVGRSFEAQEAADILIRLALSSPANTVILALQDIFNLGPEHRINNPAVHGGNWRWKVPSDLLFEERASYLTDLIDIYGRYEHVREGRESASR